MTTNRTPSPATLEARAYAQLARCKAALVKAKAAKCDALVKLEARVKSAELDLAEARASYEAACEANGGGVEQS